MPFARKQKPPFQKSGAKLLYALATGFEPVVSSVTGRRVDRATPREHNLLLYKHNTAASVPRSGIEPALIAYETTLDASLLPGKRLIKSTITNFIFWDPPSF